MSAKPKVSVIVPNYNYGRFLQRRLRSVLGQTYTDFEVIYHDDCSTDNSEQVFAAFRDHPKIRDLSSENNSGNAYIPVNKCAKLARGEYLWIAQADDYADERFLEVLVPVLDNNPSVGIAYCQSQMVDENEVILRSFGSIRKFPDSDRWDSDFIAKGLDEIRTYLLFWNTIPNFSGVLFRKEVFDAVGGAEEQLPLVGDVILYIKMLQRSDIAFVAEPLNYFRQHIGTIREKSGYEGILLEGYKILEYIQDHIELSDAEMEAAFEHIMKRWRKRIFGKQKTGRWRSSMKIYGVAREVDPRLKQRLVMHIARAYTVDVAKEYTSGGKAPWKRPKDQNAIRDDLSGKTL